MQDIFYNLLLSFNLTAVWGSSPNLWFVLINQVYLAKRTYLRFTVEYITNYMHTFAQLGFA